MHSINTKPVASKYMNKRFTADYIFLMDKPPLKNGVVIVDDLGRILEISKQHNDDEIYFEGIICPGFVNAHCHIELSYAKDKIDANGGLDAFIHQLEQLKINSSEEQKKAAVEKAIEEMQNNGIVAVGDIMNSSLSIEAKRVSQLKFYNFIEVFGSQYRDAERLWYSALSLFEQADLPKNIVPHAPYSLSRTLFQKLRDFTQAGNTLSIHHLESRGELEFFDSATGPIADRMKKWELDIPLHIPTHQRPLQSIAEFISDNDNILLIHNTFIEDSDIEFANNNFNNTFYGLCPKANLYIENKLPPLELLKSKDLKICLGTDSLASNNGLSIFEEMKTLDKYFDIDFQQLLSWATINGAQALGMNDTFGSITVGKNPGLIGIKNVDISNYHSLENAEFEVLC